MPKAKILLAIIFAILGLGTFAKPSLASIVPDECTATLDPSVGLQGFTTGNPYEITYTGKVVTGACVYSDNTSTNLKHHTSVLTIDGSFDGSRPCSYTITGLGTNSVTATSESENCTLIHLDLFLGEPEQTPPPSPQPELGMSLAMIGPSCGGNGFDVVATLTDNGQPLANYDLTFTYKGNVIAAKTDANGQAKASIGYQGDSGVTVEAAGIDAQVAWAAYPNGCPGGNSGGGTQVLGASTEGQVLGASTLAATTGSDYRAILALYVLGSGLVITGLLKNAFTKSKSDFILV